MSERADFAAWQELMSQPVIIWHNIDGESFRQRGCAECRGVSMREYRHADPSTTSLSWEPCRTCVAAGTIAGNPIDLDEDGVPQPVAGYPTDHPQGRCFACSGVRGPKPRKVKVTAGSGLRR